MEGVKCDAKQDLGGINYSDAMDYGRVREQGLSRAGKPRPAASHLWLHYQALFRSEQRFPASSGDHPIRKMTFVTDHSSRFNLFCI